VGPKQIALWAKEAALTKKANDAVILEMKGLSPIIDYFVIVSGNSSVHLQAIADAVKERMNAEGIKINHIEGYQQARWALLDYGEVVVHIFHEPVRRFYDLENLWGDAKVIK